MFLRLSTISIAAIVIAATAASSDDRQLTPPPENCRDAPPPADEQDAQERGDQTTQSLSSKLGPCDGVLKPPAVGDEELTQPPPAAGEMRVIPPHELPEQQAKPEGG